MIASLLFPALLTTVISGNASSNTTVRTNVSGADARVNTSVTTTVNGETVTVTSDKPGSIEVRRDDNTSEIIINGQPITPTITVGNDHASRQSGQSTPSGEAKETIGDSKQASFRYYVYGFVKRAVISAFRYIERILDKL